MYLLWPVLIIGFVVASFVWRKKMLAQANATYAAFRLADVAQRLGLAVVEGDPALNLVMAQSAHAVQGFQSAGGVLGALAGDGTKEMRARAQGTPWGRPFELVYFQRSDVEVGVLETTHTHYFECSLAARVNATFPPFEIHLRSPAAHLEPSVKTALPQQQTGNHGLDQVMVVKTADPRVAAALAPALLPLMTQAFVHIVGRDGEIRALTTHASHSVLVMGAEQFERALEHMACVLEGRAATHLVAAA